MALVFLEAFDATEPESSVPEGPSEDWLDGHAAGVAEGLESASHEAARRAAELAESLADLNTTIAEARREVLAGLAPLFEAMLGQILPALTERSVVQHGVALLMDAAEDASDPPLMLTLNPRNLAVMAQALDELSCPQVDLRAEDDLGTGEIVLTRRGSDTVLDLGRLSRDLADLLDNLATPGPASKDLRHG